MQLCIPFFIDGYSGDGKVSVTILKVVLGLLLIVIALHDMFHTLFHPSGRGVLAEFISFRLWRLWRHLFPARHDWLAWRAHQHLC